MRKLCDSRWCYFCDREPHSTIFFVFPRVNYRDHFIAGGPSGSSGCANPSGWMQEENFLQFLKHFHSVAKSTLDKPVLLLPDNHGSHLSIDGLNFAKANEIIMLSFPPRCSHRLQPLDRAVFGPFKRYYNTAADAWMLNNPGKTMTIYDIPGIVSTAYPLAMTPSNIQSGFRCTGIFPFNRDIFTDEDFAPGYVLDRPQPEINNEGQPGPSNTGCSEPTTNGTKSSTSNENRETSMTELTDPKPSTSNGNRSPQNIL
ncbi:hypothetical protein ANN_18989 [Periplaneta americana]|uniref:DDE-1 domain-containing protein n=1 Tax=Periplaneta americana TaxID=6978 RepID=A0ABQ8SRT4_PERAM|nr:hypothetical protein ANN_18989 [Periplaneta americana]